MHGFKELTNQKRTSIQNEPIRIGLPKKGTNQRAYSLITGQSEEDIHIHRTNQSEWVCQKELAIQRSTSTQNKQVKRSFLKKTS